MLPMSHSSSLELKAHSQRQAEGGGGEPHADSEPSPLARTVPAVCRPLPASALHPCRAGAGSV